MCWKTKGRLKPVVASKDIKVYKVMFMDGDDNIKSAYRSFEYRLGEVYREMVNPFPYFPEGEPTLSYAAKEGFHSYNPENVRIEVEGNTWLEFLSLSGSFIDTWGDNWRDNMCALFECIIPEGSTYYENERGEVVSDAISIRRFVSWVGELISSVGECVVLNDYLESQEKLQSITGKTGE